MGRFALASGLVLASVAPAAHAGDVLRVGPTKAFATLQAAVDAAGGGDVILVDPGTYPAFVVDGKALSIVGADGAAFDVQTAPGVPAIRVRNVPAGGVASVLGARVSYAEPSVPAVHVTANAGAVRFSRLLVSLDADLPNAAPRAAVEVEDTASFWLIDSQVWSTIPRLGNTLDPAGANDGLSALEMRDSDGVVQNVLLRGYDNSGMYAGDGLRARGDVSAWLRTDIVNNSANSRFAGGNGGAYGGHAVHLVGPKGNRDQIKMCPGLALDPSSGALQKGGKYGINDDPGITTFPCGPGWTCTSYRTPDTCAGEQLGENTLLADTVAPGGLITLRVWTARTRSYTTVMSATTRYARSLGAFAGHPLIRTSSFVVVSSGVSVAGVTTVVNLPVPSQSGLAGLQLTFQTALGPVGGPYDSLSAPALCVIAP
jgi:hypothetical protein